MSSLISSSWAAYAKDFNPASWATVLCLIAFGIGSIKWNVTKFIFGKDIGNIPQLPGWPIIGALPLDLKQGFRVLLDRLNTVAGEEGVAYANLGLKKVVYLSNPALIREVLSQPDEVFSREGNGRKFSSPFVTIRELVGPTLFTFLGGQAKRGIQAYRNIVGSHKVLVNNFDFLVEVASKHVNRLASAGSSTQEDLKRMGVDFAIDMWGQFIFDVEDSHKDLDSNGLLSVDEKILALLVDMRHNIYHRIRHLLTGFDPVEQKLAKWLRSIVQTRMGQVLDQEQRGVEMKHQTLRKFTVATGGPKSGPFTEDSEAFANFSIWGGHHTIGLMIGWAVYQLNRNPACMAKVKAELEALNPSGSVDSLSLEKIQKHAPYLEAVLSETARLYGTVHSTARTVNQEYTLTTPQGSVAHLIPGMVVFFSFYHLHRAPHIWGADADQFVPERFLDGRYKSHNSHYFPFGYGTRRCPGYPFAMLATKIYMAILLRSHEVNMENNGQAPRWTGLLDSEKPFPFSIKPQER